MYRRKTNKINENSDSNFNKIKESLKTNGKIDIKRDIEHKKLKIEDYKDSNLNEEEYHINHKKQIENNYKAAYKPIQISKEIEINICQNETKKDTNKHQKNNAINKNNIHNYEFIEDQPLVRKKESLPNIDKIYEKGIENYKKYLQINKEINQRLILDKNTPLSTRNQYSAFDILKNSESASSKKYLYNNKTLNHYVNYPNSHRSNERTEKSLNNEKLDKIENDVSPIRNEVKIRFTEGELNEILSGNLLDSDRNEINDFTDKRKTTYLNRDFNVKPNAFENNLKDWRSKEMKNNYNIKDNFESNMESSYRKYNNNKLNLEFEKNHYENMRSDKLNNNYFSNIETPENKINYRNGKIDYRSKNIKTDQENEITNKIFTKIPQIILGNNKLKYDIVEKEDYTRPVYMNNNFAYLNNLVKKKPIYNLQIDPKNTTKDLLNEAENLINKHLVNKDENKLSPVNKSNYLDESLSNNRSINNSDINRRVNTTEENKKDEINRDSKQDLNHKINYIYDFLKDISKTKLDENIFNNLIKTREKEDRSAIEKKKQSNNFEDDMKKNIEKNEENNNIIHLDNHRISFEMPRSKQNLDSNRKENHFNLEEDKKRWLKEEKINSSPGMLLSPQSKSALEDLLKLSKINYPINKNQNIYYKEDEFENETPEKFNKINLNRTDISEIKKAQYSELKQRENFKNAENTSDQITKKEDKLLNSIKYVEKQEIINNILEKKELMASIRYPNGAQYNNNIALNPNKSDNSEIEDQNNEFALNKKDDSDQLNGDNDEDEYSEEYDIRAENYYSETENEKEVDEEELNLNQNKVEDSNILNAKKLESNHKDTNIDSSSNKNNSLSEEESLKDGYINRNNLVDSEIKIKTRLNASDVSVNKNEFCVINQKPKVKFALRHSYSTKSQNKNPEYLKDNFIDEELNMNKKHNNSDFDFENVKIDENIKTELNKKVISDTPYCEKSSDNKVKFSKNLVFIRYNDESVAEDIKIMDKNGNPKKHKKFNLLKYLIRLKNNKYKAKKILRNYYNGIREDRLPKKILSSLKKTNTFNEEDKEIGLQKLNEFLHECNKENQILELQEMRRKVIGKLIILKSISFIFFSSKEIILIFQWKETFEKYMK